MSASMRTRVLPDAPSMSCHTATPSHGFCWNPENARDAIWYCMAMHALVALRIWSLNSTSISLSAA